MLYVAMYKYRLLYSLISVMKHTRDGLLGGIGFVVNSKSKELSRNHKVASVITTFTETILVFVFYLMEL